MKIKNLSIKSTDANKFLGKENIALLQESIEFINRLFKYNASVNIEFIDIDSLFSVMPAVINLHPYTDAIAIQNRIYILKDRFRNNELTKLMIHEYIHVCISTTFSHPCPVWLNEGLAVCLSGQLNNVEAMCPKVIDSFYVSNQSDANFYNMAAYVVENLLIKHGTQQIIDKARSCNLFDTDNIFGVSAIRALIESVEYVE